MSRASNRCWVLQGSHALSLGDIDPIEVLRAVAGGVYEGFRTYGGQRVYRFGAHALRLESGRAQLKLGTAIDLQALGQGIEHVLHQLQNDHASQDWKVRVDHAESNLRALGPLGECSALVVQAWPLNPVPQTILDNGAHCALEYKLARDHPEIKGTSFSLRRMQHNFPSGENYESILVAPDGSLLEGVMSGLGFLQGSVLRTAGSGVLPSLTVESLCGLAEAKGLKVRREALKADELAEIDEAFLASSVRGIVPIRRIGEVEIGKGSSPQRTLELRSLLATRARLDARSPAEG